MNDSSEDLILQTKSLEKRYAVSEGFLSSLRGSKSYNYAVDGVDLKLFDGETYGLVGESGSGKSTLGETILRLREPTNGDIIYRGKYINSLSSQELKEYRRSAQIILQDPYEALNPRQTVFQIVSEPLRNFNAYESGELRETVLEMLSDVGLRPPTEIVDCYPSQLSGGQQQRVNIARALILEPELLVADEPLSMLDVSVQAGIINLLNDLQDDYGFTMLYISHNLAIVKLLSDRIGVMYKGNIVEEGDADTLINTPTHPYSQALVNSVPNLNIDRDRVQLPSDMVDDGNSISGCKFHPRCPKKMDECVEDDPELDILNGEEVENNRKVACYLYHSDGAGNEQVTVGDD